MQAPIPVQPWNKIRSAVQMGQSCPQGGIITSNQQSNDIEDCLNLNIFAPAIPLKNRKRNLFPVMVFIHGGFFSTGNKADFSPAYILEHNVILVVPNYRLDALGIKFKNHFDEFPFDNNLLV